MMTIPEPPGPGLRLDLVKEEGVVKQGGAGGDKLLVQEEADRAVACEDPDVDFHNSCSARGDRLAGCCFVLKVC